MTAHFNGSNVNDIMRPSQRKLRRRAAPIRACLGALQRPVPNSMHCTEDALSVIVPAAELCNCVHLDSGRHIQYTIPFLEHKRAPAEVQTISGLPFRIDTVSLLSVYFPMSIPAISLHNVFPLTEYFPGKKASESISHRYPLRSR